MRLRVASATLAPGVKARETADWETPASSATSLSVGARRRLRSSDRGHGSFFLRVGRKPGHAMLARPVYGAGMPVARTSTGQ